jgi:hypothetical protein
MYYSTHRIAGLPELTESVDEGEPDAFAEIRKSKLGHSLSQQLYPAEHDKTE